MTGSTCLPSSTTTRSRRGRRRPLWLPGWNLDRFILYLVSWFSQCFVQNLAEDSKVLGVPGCNENFAPGQTCCCWGVSDNSPWFQNTLVHFCAIAATTKSICSSKRDGWWHNLGWFSPNSHHAIPCTWFPYLVLINFYTRIFRLACFVIENTDLKICIPRSHLFPTYIQIGTRRGADWVLRSCKVKLQWDHCLDPPHYCQHQIHQTPCHPDYRHHNQHWLKSCFPRLNGYVAGYGDQVNAKKIMFHI